MMVLCQFLGTLAGVALLQVFGIDMELGQVTIIVVASLSSTMGLQLQLSSSLLLLLAAADLAVQGE
jgi:hypothetical protein